MDVRHNHNSDVFCVRACYHDDAADLVAIGGAHSVEVLLTTPTSSQVIANFHLGTRITTLAWSPGSTSPSITDDWSIELTCAGADFGLYLLSKSSASAEDVFAFGGGLSGHHGKVSDMAFCGGQSEDSTRYVATVSDDKMLMVWDLSPSVDVVPPPSPGRERSSASSTAPRAQPTAYVIRFPHPLTTVASHPSTSKEFLVADCRGSVFLIDWRADPDENPQDSWRNSSIVELVEPRALADAATGLSNKWSAAVAWSRGSPDIIGAVYGSRFALWDLLHLRGGKPHVTGTTFPEGGNQFRWCPTYPEYFAISANAPGRGAVIHVHNTGYVHAQPTVFSVGPRPLFVRDFDFLAARGIPRIAAAVGRELVIFYIGVDS
ncbi:hypothetical protein CERSUDRAFT_159048 [Gelatoporia subvermispora B]|uniref:Uncharacterized protein n=1 Tax=Ceriporiopsis subvermispora (strain B) TaxID=914234 RepID=M2PF34_CERS8|nr:hypothetical protein CERSUDRAFT_159048 [Gelatoporia subvermispora B]